MSNSSNPAHMQNNVTYIDTKMTSDRATLSRLDELVFIPQLVSSPTPLSPTPSLIFSSSPSLSDYSSIDDFNNSNNNDKDTDMVMFNENALDISSSPAGLHYNEIDYLVNSLSLPLSSLSIDDSEESDTKKLYHQQRHLQQIINNKDRGKKIKEMIINNSQELNLIKRNCSNCSDEDWDSFINLLYSNSISDDDLFEIIKNFINPNFSIFNKLQDIIFGTNANVNNNNKNNNNNNDKEFDIKIIRDYPHVLINIESKYQNFFNNLKFCLYQESKVRLLQNQRYGLDQQLKHQYQPTSLLSSKYLEDDLHMINTINNNYYYNNFILNNDVIEDDEITLSKNENSELYDHFIRILFTTRGSMPDDLWEESVFECLGNWPNLIEQFKQIIIHETINF